MTDELVKKLRERHQRAASLSDPTYLPWVCGQCRVSWPCPSIRAADRIEELEGVLRTLADDYGDTIAARIIRGATTEQGDRT